MGDLEITDGDFSLLARRTDDVAQDVEPLSSTTDMAGAPSAMPASTAASLVGDAAASADRRLRTLSSGLRDIARAAHDSQASFTATEDSLTRSLAPTSPSRGGSDAFSHVATRLG
ncbi:MAG: hypothetical protein L0L69_02405 [Propionibacterium sp.]|nr:hypothetical protein [Propionibacterium sp.]